MANSRSLLLIYDEELVTYLIIRLNQFIFALPLVANQAVASADPYMSVVRLKVESGHNNMDHLGKE